jgi:hypothetical protein
MTDRERMLAIMDGRHPDRIPWIPRLSIWHTALTRQEALPEHLRSLSLRGVEQSLGMGTPARNGHIVKETQGGDIEVTSRSEGQSVLTTYRTPAGTVETRDRTSEELQRAGIRALEVEHLIKGPDDYPAVEYLMTHREYAPTYDAYMSYEDDIGDDGYPLVSTGDCPFHHFLQKLAGYQTGHYHVVDYPDRVEHLLRTMEDVERERLWPLIADSPARLIGNGSHFDSSITPPPLFDRYITPYCRDLSALLHSRGKKLCLHADNDSRLILERIRDAGYDMAETFTTAPQVTCTLEEARRVWRTDVIIWGAVPSVILESAFADEEFEAYMRDVFRTVAPGDAFILGVADNVMPNALLDRLERITDMVEEWGEYPIDPGKIP